MQKQLEKYVELDNVAYMNEVERQSQAVDYSKIMSALAAQQQNYRPYNPEPKRDFDFGGGPDVF